MASRASMKIALAQISPTVGDIDGNTEQIISAVERAKGLGAEVVVTPELAVFGYPPKDLVLRGDMIERNLAATRRIASHCRGITAFVGFVEPVAEQRGTGIFNAAAFCRDGKIESTYAKRLLPTYDVFDDARYFTPGACVRTVKLESRTAAISICEDLWNNRQFDDRKVYAVDPIAEGRAAGADLLINLSASPFRAEIADTRLTLFGDQIRRCGVPLVYVNQVCGNDDLIFDGASCVFGADGRLIARAKAFAQDLLLVDLDAPQTARMEAYPDRLGSIRAALILGIREYARKCGLSDVVLGLSGGVDSALTAVLAVEALGASQVHGVAMPSRFSSPESLEDARKLASNLGIDFRVIEIERAHGAFEQLLHPHFQGRAENVAEENLQSRIRGNLLMALANKFGWLTLCTGNKSELAAGYCTLYGDLCGALAVLGDLTKTSVYELAREVNRVAGRDVIPARTITRVPTAELRPGQTDQDTLPPYNTLDAILTRSIEEGHTADKLVADGFDRALVDRVLRMVAAAEHKRRQAPIVLRVTRRAFSSGWRMPVAARTPPP